MNEQLKNNTIILYFFICLIDTTTFLVVILSSNSRYNLLILVCCVPLVKTLYTCGDVILSLLCKCWSFPSSLYLNLKLYTSTTCMPLSALNSCAVFAIIASLYSSFSVSEVAMMFLVLNIVKIILCFFVVLIAYSHYGGLPKSYHFIIRKLIRDYYTEPDHGIHSHILINMPCVYIIDDEMIKLEASVTERLYIFIKTTGSDLQND